MCLLLRKPVYEGLKKVGEDLSCAVCGHKFASEEDLQPVEKQGQTVFTEADKSRKIEVFAQGEARICRYCAHYVVNPFTQWCGRHRKEVQATDTCSAFSHQPPPAKPQI